MFCQVVVEASCPFTGQQNKLFMSGGLTATSVSDTNIEIKTRGYLLCQQPAIENYMIKTFLPKRQLTIVVAFL